MGITLFPLIIRYINSFVSSQVIIIPIAIGSATYVDLTLHSYADTIIYTDSSLYYLRIYLRLPLDIIHTL
jgi:hypothetical protein